ncbi:MAG: transglutaminase domain-containing protein [Paracoccaceae bacterium]
MSWADRIEIVAAEAPGPGAQLLAPVGVASGLGTAAGLEVDGGRIDGTLSELATGQTAVRIVPEGSGQVRLTYRFAATPAAPRYPDAAFAPRRSRYTEAAEDLADASRRIAQGAGGGRAGIDALVAEARARFTYGHVERRFNDGCEVVPFLGCGVAEGSCVDINTYLVASLRAAGYEAAYLYGYFFPAEKDGTTTDMHCWVATRHGSDVLDWDIAHHIKAGLDPVRPALDPRPGQRVLIGHSMGHRYQTAASEIAVKLLAEPLWIAADGRVHAPHPRGIRARSLVPA